MPNTNAFSPGLSPSSSLLISTFIVGSYVGGLYVARSSRLSFAKPSASHKHDRDRVREQIERRRDDDEVIRARLKAALLSTCVSCGVVVTCIGLRYNSGGRSISAINIALDLMGLNPSRLGYRSILPNLLIPLLYSGPLTAQFLSSALPFQRYWSYQNNLRPIFTTWIGLRNYIVAPITEEIVFRACLLAIADLSGKGLYHKLFITPLWFGVAHLHHAYENYYKFGSTRKALQLAILTCLVQMTYTTLFGAYASFLFLRSGSLIPAITAHITANIMSLPLPGWDLSRHPNHKKCTLFNMDTMPLTDLPVKVILAAYLTGIAGFALASGPWTASML